jgi:hypothetical protein
MSEKWLPIESAPKSGRVILGGWKSDDHTERVWWTPDAGWQGSESGFWDSKNWPDRWHVPSPTPRE